MSAVTKQPRLSRASHTGSVEYLGGMEGPLDDDVIEMEEKRTIESATRSVSSMAEIRRLTPAGLEKMNKVRMFVLQQEIENKEVWWNRTLFKIGTGDGKFLFTGKEMELTNGCIQSIMGKGRAYYMKISDNENDNYILEMEHPANCWSPSVCPWSVPTINVRLPTGELLGQVKHTPRETCISCLGPSTYFEVYNYDGKLTYKVLGATCYPCECKSESSTTFKVIKLESGDREEHVGLIEHEWRGPCGGLCSWCVTDKLDYATITFPENSQSEDKALFMALLILAASCYYQVL